MYIRETGETVSQQLQSHYRMLVTRAPCLDSLLLVLLRSNAFLSSSNGRGVSWRVRSSCKWEWELKREGRQSGTYHQRAHPPWMDAYNLLLPFVRRDGFAGSLSHTDLWDPWPTAQTKAAWTSCSRGGKPSWRLQDMLHGAWKAEI